MANITIPANLNVGDTFVANSKTFKILGIIDAPNSKYVYEQTSVLYPELNQSQAEDATNSNFGLISGERLAQSHNLNTRVLYGSGPPSNPPATINPNLSNSKGFLYVNDSNGHLYAWDITGVAWTKVTVTVLSNAQATDGLDTTVGTVTGVLLKAVFDKYASKMGNYEGVHDASGGAVPSNTGLEGQPLVAGDWLRATNPGTLAGADNGPDIAAGDILIAKINNPAIGSDWSIIDGSANITYQALNITQANDNSSTFEGLITGSVLQAAITNRIEVNFSNSSSNTLRNSTVTNSLKDVGINQSNKGASFPASPDQGTLWVLDGHGTLNDGLYQADSLGGWQSITSL